MYSNKRPSRFNFLVFNLRAQPGCQNEKKQEVLLNDSQDLGVPLVDSESFCGSSISDDDSSPVPEIETHKAMSTVLNQVQIPKNPLSDIGDLSETKLLTITNSPNVGALTEVIFIQLKLKGRGLSEFESSRRLVLSRLLNLTVLDLSNNYISSLNDLCQCTGLIYLNVSSNIIESLSPLQTLVKLVTLKASSNKIKDIVSLKSCEKLQKLGLSNNLIVNFESTLNTLKKLPKLNYLSVHSNPCIYKTKNAKSRILSALKLTKLDKEDVESKQNNPFHRVTHYRKIPIHESSDDQDSTLILKRQVMMLKKENADLKKELNKVYSIFEENNKKAEIH